MVATEEQIFPSRITDRLFVWLAALLFLFAALAAVPVSATASAKALCVPQNCIGEHSAAAPFAMLPTIASPDWSKNPFVSNDPAHGISKFLGGQAVTTLATAGASELPEALSSGTEGATNLLPGATTGVADLADANTATTLPEDAVGTPTADAARDAIAAREAPASTEHVFSTVGGVRRVDVLKLGNPTLAIESKVGRTVLDARVRQELARDWWLKRQGQVGGVRWEFTRSSATGEIGPTAPLLQKLQKLGFKVKVNP